MNPRVLPAVALMTLAGCVAAPPAPGTAVQETRFAEAAVPGKSTKASLLAALGPTHKVTFNSGYEAWLYTVPASGGRHTELVVLIGPDGVVRKTRRRDP